MNEGIQSYVCTICQAKSSYICPRCGINYCSLMCYRAPEHSRCSESFYRDCCVESMHNQFVTADNKTRMLEILRREAVAQAAGDSSNPSGTEKIPLLEVESETSESDTDDFQSRFSDINLESNEVDVITIWDRLTIKERRDFHRLVASGAFSNYLSTWEPWWLESKMHVEELEHGTKVGSFGSRGSTLNYPISMKKIFPSGKQPHHSVAYTLAEVVLVYAFLCRLYNGDYQDLKSECLMHLSQLAVSLCCTHRETNRKQAESETLDTTNRTVILTPVHARQTPEYSHLSHVIGALQLRLSNLRLPCSPQVIVVLLGDLHAILTNQCHLARVFVDLLDLVRGIRKQTELEDGCEGAVTDGHLKMIYRKVRFFQACVNPLDADAQRWQVTALQTLQSETEFELCRQVSDFDRISDVPDPIRGPAAGPNWRHMIRSTPKTAQPSITVLNTD